MGYTDKFRPPKTKVCITCKKDLPLKDYPTQTDNKDNRGSKCRQCLKEVEERKKAGQAEYAKNYFTF